jgi:MFS family permease
MKSMVPLPRDRLVTVQQDAGRCHHADTPRAPTAADGMPNGFYLLLTTQFVSALADHALLVIAIGLLQHGGAAAWWIPILKVLHIGAYVALAPWAGLLADALPKARVMAAMNAVKLAGTAAMLAGLHPMLAFAAVGCGAAAYAPAKYGWVVEACSPGQLVRANAWIEVSVIGAALLGTALGGFLAGPWHTAWWRDSATAGGWAGGVLAGGSGLEAGLAAVLALYALAGLMNLALRDLQRRDAASPSGPGEVVHRFVDDNARFWRDPVGRLSLLATSLSWGFGAVLQFAVLRWAQSTLGLGLDTAAYLQAVVAIGLGCGAAAAGRWIALHQAGRVLPLGIVAGLLVAAGALAPTATSAAAVLVGVGALGGALVVPMNALLQHRGQQLVSAGRSIAVQGFNENLAVLAMLSGYAALVACEVDARAMVAGLGAGLAVAIGWLARRPSPAAPASARDGH